MDRYDKGVVLGEGRFGSVVKATVKETGQEVAIKKVRIAQAKEGIHVTALREIKVLKELRSPYIIQLVDVFTTSNQNLSIVLELMESDLEAVIKDTSLVLSQADVKSYMKMALTGLATCHAQNVVHRDIKPNNFLTSRTGVLKLADFGLAKVFGSPDGCRTSQVFARWYRAPELLWGSTAYGPAVDIWAMGCVFAELMLRRPWFVAESDIQQLQCIFSVLGTPTLERWKTMTDLPSFVLFSECKPKPLNTIFPQASDDAIDLLSSMMQFNPSVRITAEEALQHKFFTGGVPPTPPERLPRPKSRAEAPLLGPTNAADSYQLSEGHSHLGVPEPTKHELATRQPYRHTLRSCLDTMVETIYTRHGKQSGLLPQDSNATSSTSWITATSGSHCLSSSSENGWHSFDSNCRLESDSDGALRDSAGQEELPFDCRSRCMSSPFILGVNNLESECCSGSVLNVRSGLGEECEGDLSDRIRSTAGMESVALCTRLSADENKGSVQNRLCSLGNDASGFTPCKKRRRFLDTQSTLDGKCQLTPELGNTHRQYDSPTPLLWPGNLSETSHRDATACSAVMQPLALGTAPTSCNLCPGDSAGNPFSLFANTDNPNVQSSVPTPVKEKLNKNLFGS